MALAETRLVMIGSPGAETAEVADHLAARLGLSSISIRDAMQSAVRTGSDLGDELRRFMDAEQVPPPELIAALVQRLVGELDVVDGFVYWTEFPTLPVMQSLETLGIQAVELALVDAEATRRLTGRRTCRGCGKIWHAQPLPTLVDGVCDRCGSELFQRDDDAPATVARQLSVYHTHSAPILAHYRDAGLLISVDATRPTEEIVTELTRRLGLS